MTKYFQPRRPTARQKLVATAFQSNGTVQAPAGLTEEQQVQWMKSPEGQAALTADSLRALKEADMKPKYERIPEWPYAQPTVPIRDDQRLVQDPAAFMKAGNATFTVVSKATGTRFTYKVVKVKSGDVFFVKVLTGTDNENSYTYLGTIFADGEYRHGKRSPIGYAAPSAEAFRWFMRNLGSDKVEVYHEGRCCRCGRKLTVPSSVESGIGPECAGKM